MRDGGVCRTNLGQNRPGLLKRHYNFKTDWAWGQNWWKSHKQETPNLLTDADKSTDTKKSCYKSEILTHLGDQFV